jgi:hypothetical protein
MPQILQTTRALPTETLSWEPFLGLSGTGAPSFDTARDLDANVVLYDTARIGSGSADEYLIDRDGTRIEIAMTLYVQGDVAAVPVQGDRITRSGIVYLVAERKDVAGLYYLPGQPDHFRLRCRAE